MQLVGNCRTHRSLRGLPVSACHAAGISPPVSSVYPAPRARLGTGASSSPAQGELHQADDVTLRISEQRDRRFGCDLGERH